MVMLKGKDYNGADLGTNFGHKKKTQAGADGVTRDQWENMWVDGVAEVSDRVTTVATLHQEVVDAAVAADADAQATAADRQAVATDKTAVHADRLAADADAVATAADRAAVAADKTAVHADRVAADADAQATAADRQAVVTDKAAVHADRLAADADAAATAADRSAVAMDKAAVHSDRLAADADAAATAADRQAVATDKAAVHADRLAVDGSAIAAAGSATLADQYAVAAGGAIPSVRLTWDTATADADPGAGKVRASNPTLTAATALYVDNLDVAGTSITAVLDRWTASTNTVKGTLRVAHRTNITKWIDYQVTGSVVDGGGYRKISVTGGTGPGGFTNGDPVAVGFSRAGDVGVGDTAATPNTLAQRDGTGSLVATGHKTAGGWAEVMSNANGLGLFASNLYHDGTNWRTRVTHSGIGGRALVINWPAWGAISFAEVTGATVADGIVTPTVQTIWTSANAPISQAASNDTVAKRNIDGTLDAKGFNAVTSGIARVRIRDTTTTAGQGFAELLLQDDGGAADKKRVSIRVADGLLNIGRLNDAENEFTPWLTADANGVVNFATAPTVAGAGIAGGANLAAIHAALFSI